MEMRTKDPLAEIDFLTPAFQDDPYGVYAYMIANHPIFYSERYGQFFAFSAVAVRSVMVNRDFTVASPFRATRTLFGPPWSISTVRITAACASRCRTL